MRRFIMGALALMGAAMPSMALFTNGGFEQGDLTGWSIRWGKLNHGLTPPRGTIPADPKDWEIDPYMVWNGSANWDGVSSGNPNDPTNPLHAYAVADGTLHNPYFPAFDGTTKYPGNNPPNNFTALLNMRPSVAGGDDFLDGNFDVTEFSQKDKVTTSDLSYGLFNGQVLPLGYRVFAQWGAVMEDPGHPIVDRPRFHIRVWVKTPVAGVYPAAWSLKKDDFQVSSNGATNGWVASKIQSQHGEQVFGKAETFMVDVALNDSVKIDITTIDCSQGAHGSFAYLDYVGPVIPPNDVVLAGDPCVYGAISTDIRDRSKISGNIGSGSGMTFGNDVKITGLTQAAGYISFGQRDSLSDVIFKTGTNLPQIGYYQIPNTTVTQDPTLVQPALPTFAVVPGTETKYIWTPTPLTPGKYKDVVVGSTITLVGGSVPYEFDNLTLYANAVVNLDNSAGPITIRTRTSLVIGNAKMNLLVTNPGAPDLDSRAVNWYSNGTLDLQAGSNPVIGFFLAPNANITVPNRKVQGYVHANRVVVDAATGTSAMVCTGTY